VTPASHAPASDASRWSPAPDRLQVQAAARLGVDSDAVQAALDDLDATVQRREEQRRAGTRKLVAELYSRYGVTAASGRVDAEAEAACAQERDERLAAELRRLVTPPVAAVRRAWTLSEQELDSDCQAALNVLGTAPHSLAEFQPEAEQRHAAERAVLGGFAAWEVGAAALLEKVRGWRVRRRRGLWRELADAVRGRQAATYHVRLAAARLAAVQLREAQRTEWLAQPEVQEVLGAGAAALRELHDRAHAPDAAATAELPAVARPVAPWAAR
jgi:hypothetical protein